MVIIRAKFDVCTLSGFEGVEAHVRTYTRKHEQTELRFMYEVTEKFNKVLIFP